MADRGKRMSLGLATVRSGYDQNSRLLRSRHCPSAQAVFSEIGKIPRECGRPTASHFRLLYRGGNKTIGLPTIGSAIHTPWHVFLTKPSAKRGS